MAPSLLVFAVFVAVTGSQSGGFTLLSKDQLKRESCPSAEAMATLAVLELRLDPAEALLCADSLASYPDFS